VKLPAGLRLGCVKYLNARPLIHGSGTPVEFNHPSALCQRLARGELDVALVSSFELFRNRGYSVVDGVAIGSDGPVFSVVLVHEAPVEQLREIVIDPASETSVNLLRCLLGRQLGTVPRFVSEGEITPARGKLLIGDQAIEFRRQFGGCFEFYDLGAGWKNFTGLPFIYALWLIHPEFGDKETVAEALRSLAEKNLCLLDSIIAAQPEAERAFCEYYYRECLRFRFGERERKGLQKFAELCAKQNLIPQSPVALKLV
jgi:chorismate dehydratase